MVIFTERHKETMGLKRSKEAEMVHHLNAEKK